jgi:drug/metabolite transporter (DMT)-like permease|tara:strand:- start:319 stop:1179 length:861 start_codon:yes stop_codon:yes gene_type:complete
MELKDWILLTALAAIWGSAFMFIKISAVDFGPILLVTLRLLIAGLVFMPFLLRKKKRSLFKSYLPAILIIAIVSNAIPFTMFAYASLGATSNMLGILNGTTAFLTTVIAYFWLKESVSLKQIVGLLLGFIGVLILVNPSNGSTTFIASMCAMIGSLCYAFNATYLQKYHSNSDKIVLIGWSMLFGGFFMIPLASFNLPDAIPDTNSILALFWLAVISTGLGYLAYVRLIDRIGAVKTVTLTYLLPVFSIIWGAIFLQEKITSIILGGFIFVMMGMYFANTSNKSKS